MPQAAERYVEQAWEHNLALQGQSLEVTAAQARADMAEGMRQPRLDLVARYSRASGGRIIEVPAGDLINPVYTTLNQLLVAQGQPGAFPTVPNLDIPLLRKREQEAKLRFSVPLLNAELRHWTQSRRSAVNVATAQQAAARRELRLIVLNAYYLCLSLQAAEEILSGSVTTTAEALRVSRALFAVDKVTEDHVLRAEADDLAVRQQLIEATRDSTAARQAFNLLLNRPLESSIEAPPAGELTALLEQLVSGPIPGTGATGDREELAALRAAAEEAAGAEAALRARGRPSFSFVAEGGIQGPSYRFGAGADYSLASLVGELNLWDGRQRTGELGVARTRRRQIELRLEQMSEQLAAEAQQAVTAFAAARQALPAAERRSAAASRTLELVTAREREGLTNQLAFLDARRDATAARLNLEITRLHLLVASARMDRALAASTLD